MALSGNLGFVPLEEVLRLLLRSDQQGAVEVRGDEVRGRIFVTKRGITLATTSEDRDLHRHLLNSGYVDDAFMRRVVSGEASFSELGDREPAMGDLLREITVESVYQLKAKGTSFDVAEDVISPYASPRPFELEAVLDEARRRGEEWAEVSRVVSELTAPVRINRFPADGDEIRINRDAWRVLSELGGGASVRQVAERLGTTEFWAARVIADMVEQKLLSIHEEEPAEAVFEEEPRPDESWWVEPGGEGGEEVESAEAEEPQAAEPQAEVEGRFLGHYITARPDLSAPGRGRAAQAESEGEEAIGDGGGIEVGVEEDTEAFLEKVFSQLETEPQGGDEGHGLLRRRRMGPTLKEED